MVTRADLPIIKNEKLSSGVIIIAPRPELFCPLCQGTWSADPGDYFQTPDDHVFRCGPDCDNEPLVLVRRREVVIPWETDIDLIRCIQAAWNTR